MPFFIKKKRKKGSWLVIAFVFFVLLLVVYQYLINKPNASQGQQTLVAIEPGKGLNEISQELKNQGLISSSWLFQFYVWREGINNRLKSGQYYLSPTLTIKEIAAALFVGPNSKQEKTLTFIEGWNNIQVAQYLESQGFGSAPDFINLVQRKQDWWDQYSVLVSRPKDRDLEGYLFPDTYRVYSDATPSEIVEKMLDNLEAKLTVDLRNEIGRQGKTIHQILTLASILEKEVSADSDRRMVADIFYKRLESKIPLQTDSTVNYVTGKSDSRASAEDLKVDSAYNTYKYKGLPPGPICNPGLAAIMAAIYPSKNSYWYFLTTPDGKVIYSKNFEEHKAAKAKYYP